MDSLPNRLSPIAAFLSRRAHLIALALFAAVGLAVLDDYGVSTDAEAQRAIGYAVLNYIAGNAGELTGYLFGHDIYYGVAVEAPLAAVERLFGLEDSRAVFLSRHLLTHLLFLAAGFFAWLLTYRLFGSRLVALLAMLIFLLHPRIYAHSFFNSKDLPFLSVFMVALYLIHRAFRRDSVWAFALCGAGVALLANIRVMGVMLVPAVLGMLALDGFHAMKRGGGGVKRALCNAGAFSAAFAAVLYAAWPLLWRDPAEMLESFRVMSRHPAIFLTLFRGEWVRWPNIPWDYIPAWILISTPPIALALGALGIAYLAHLCAARWRGMFANSTARFGLLTVACLILPAAAVIAFRPNLYDDWRHVYFLWAPACVLAAFGLRALAAPPKPRLRSVAFALAAFGIALVAIQMVRLHPIQNEYFNPLANKNGIDDRWQMNYWGVSPRFALERMLSLQPTGRVSVNSGDIYTRNNLPKNLAIIPREDRLRTSINGFSPDFYIDKSGDLKNPVWTLEVYGAPIVSLADMRETARRAYSDAYAAAKAAEPVFKAHFDVYLVNGAAIYLREPCAEGDELGTFTASARPVHPNQAARYASEGGFDNKTFQFWDYGKIVGDACIMALKTDYPLESMRIAYRPPGSERDLWSADIPVNGHIAAYESAERSEPLARSGFDIYADGGSLIYVKRQCSDDDIRARFFLSIFPENPAYLPRSARESGAKYRPLSFEFYQHGAAFDGKCVVVRDLPDYPIDRIETGQWIPALPGEDALWRAGFALPEYYERRLRRAESSGDPAIRSNFDIYADGGALIYLKRQCAGEDARGRFWLSVFPEDPADLPQSARDAGLGHEPLNFDFANYGAIVNGDCVIVRELPEYPIGRIETGQFIPGESALWRAEFVPPEFYERRLRRAESSGDPAIRSDFDVYLADNSLLYIKKDCADDDARGRFWLSVFPENLADLPQDRRDAGLEHESLNFDFAERGEIIEGDCIIIRELPDYPIDRIETGQFIPGDGELWRGEIEVGQ